MRSCFGLWHGDGRLRRLARIAVFQQRGRCDLRLLRCSFGEWRHRSEAEWSKPLSLSPPSGRSCLPTSAAFPYWRRRLLLRAARAWHSLALAQRQRRVGLRRLGESLRLLRLRSWLGGWRAEVLRHLAHLEGLRVCIKRKKVRSFDVLKILFGVRVLPRLPRCGCLSNI